MAIGLTVVKETLETLFVQLNLSGLTPGTKYDLMRLQLRYLGEDDLGVPVYQRELPDRKALWSAVAHRVGWTAPAATATVRDYESPRRATQWFLVPSSAIGPYEYTTWATPYPVSRGVLAPTIVHFNYELQQAGEGVPMKGGVTVRSTADLSKYVTACVVDLDELKYTARGTELAVMGSQYPIFVADTREARRGSIVLKVDDLGDYNDLRSIVFPSTGAIRPVIFNAGSEPTMLLDDMRVIPLDVTIEQATHSDPSLRYVRIDFVETDPSAPLTKRIGDNDDLINAPVANFTISDTTPASGEWITLTDTSTGQYDSWDWTISSASSNRVSKFYTKGPHKVRWTGRGKKVIKLRVYGAVVDANGKTAGAHTRTKTITVH
jgi:hypothetical protein